MISDLPVASVHGRDDWNRNQRDGPQTPSGSPPALRSESSDRENRRNRPPTRREDPSDRAADQPAGEPSTPDGTEVREVERLEAELERKEQRLQHVIGQYERLLTEKNRRLTEEDRSDPADGSRWAVLSKVRNLLSRGR
ncbi:hypothetical protein GCM10008992_11710 [Halorubrum aquaticum]